MTDYALLKCAAEAMHNLKDPNFCNYSVVDGKSGVCLELGSRRGAITSYWNPLTDDGDALRLAVKLELEIRAFNGRAHAGKQNKFWCTEHWFPDGDVYAATRRAIVRAAAEIGEQIKGDQHGV